MKRNFFLSCIFALFSSSLLAKDLDAKVDNELGFRYAQGASSTVVRSKPYLKSHLFKKFGEDFEAPAVDIAFKAEQRLNESNQGEQVELRSFRFLQKGEYYALDWGLQNISWSETFGFNILDLVNPRDWSEYVFEDLSWVQLPVWALKNSLIFGSFKLQAIYVPRARNAILPKAGSYYDPLPENLALFGREDFSKKKLFKDDEKGVRIEYLFDFGLDLSLMTYEHFNRSPTYYFENGRLKIADKKLQSYAMSFTYANGGMVLRGDTLKTLKQPYFSSDLSYAEKDELQGIYGMDYTFENQFILGAQYQFAQTSGYQWGALQLKKTIEDFDLQCLLFWGINNDDRWARPEVTWHLPYNMSLRAYYDYIQNKKDQGVLGPFHNKNTFALNWNWLF